jgi:hypothetical protein
MATALLPNEVKTNETFKISEQTKGKKARLFRLLTDKSPDGTIYVQLDAKDLSKGGRMPPFSGKMSEKYKSISITIDLDDPETVAELDRLRAEVATQLSLMGVIEKFGEHAEEFAVQKLETSGSIYSKGKIRDEVTKARWAPSLTMKVPFVDGHSGVSIKDESGQEVSLDDLQLYNWQSVILAIPSVHVKCSGAWSFVRQIKAITVVPYTAPASVEVAFVPRKRRRA